MSGWIAGMLLALAAIPMAWAAGPAPGGPAWYEARCANCHGQNGWGDEEKRVPAIAGLPAAYVMRQIEAYRKNLREETRMHREAATGDGDFAGAAAAIAAMTPLRPVREGPADPGNGGKIVRELCSECHGEQAQGMAERGAPPLTGFQAWYIVEQIQRFKDFERSGDAGSLDSSRMHAIAYKVISIEDVEDVAAFLVDEGARAGRQPGALP